MAGFILILAPNVLAAQKIFDFDVSTHVNRGEAYSAPNPKDDNEQNAIYLHVNTLYNNRGCILL